MPPRHRLPLAVAVAALLALAAAAAFAPSARSQINAAPSWVPIGTSAGDRGSVAWFHEPGARQVAACRLLDLSGPTGSIICTRQSLP